MMKTVNFKHLLIIYAITSATKMNTPNRGVKYSKKLAVLKNTKMPALLIEIDFISNKDSRKLFKK